MAETAETKAGAGKGRLRPESAEERHAANTLQAAKEVAVEIERLKGAFRGIERGNPRRARIRQDLFDATERLCNIMALAVYQLSATLSADFQATLTTSFAELRTRLVQLGVHLMIDRIEKIHSRASTVLGGEPYPLGLASRLRAAYVDLLHNLQTMGGEDSLSNEQRALVRATGDYLDKLADIEGEIGMVIDLSGGNPTLGGRVDLDTFSTPGSG